MNGHGDHCSQAVSCINCGGNHSALNKSECVPFKKIQNDLTQKRINQIINAIDFGQDIEAQEEKSRETSRSMNSNSTQNFSKVASYSREIEKIEAKQSDLDNRSEQILNAVLKCQSQNEAMLKKCEETNMSNLNLKAEVQDVTTSVKGLLKSIKEVVTQVVREEINQVWSQKEELIDQKISYSKDQILAYVSENFVSKAVSPNSNNLLNYNNNIYNGHQNNQFFHQQSSSQNHHNDSMNM